MKTKEVIKALEQCCGNKCSMDCPLHQYSDCQKTLRNFSLTKLKKLKTENKKLKAEIKMLREQDCLSCEGCKFEYKAPNKKPCKVCSERYLNKFEPMS